MNDDAVDLALVGRLLRHRWRVMVTAAILGALIGAALSPLLSPGYASSSKVLLQGGRGQDSLLGEVQIATSLVVLDRTAAALDWGQTGRDLRGLISANALEGNVIEVTATGSTPEQARQLAERATSEYTSFSTQIVSDAAAAFAELSQLNRDAVQRKIVDAQSRIDQLEGADILVATDAPGIAARDELSRARKAVDDARRELAALDRKDQDLQVESSIGTTSVRVIEPAVLPGGPASPTLVQLIVGGALLLPMLVVLGYLVALRSERRVRDATKIARAVDTKVLGTVMVDDARRRRRLRPRRDDRSWASSGVVVSDDVRSRRSHYRRILTQAQPHGTRRLMILIPNDDPNARVAVMEIAEAAAEGGRTVAVATEDAVLADAVCAAGERRMISLYSRNEVTDTVLHVDEIAAAQPSITDGGEDIATILIVGSGTRTAMELVGISIACAEARRRLVGVVAVLPRSARKRKGERQESAANAPEAQPVLTDSAAGST